MLEHLIFSHGAIRDVNVPCWNIYMIEKVLLHEAAIALEATRLHREIFGEALTRRDYERLIGTLVREGWITEQADSFEKDGRVIEFRRLFLTPIGRNAPDSSSLRMIEEPKAPRKTRGKRVGAIRVEPYGKPAQ